jgi:hypothetical protein
MTNKKPKYVVTWGNEHSKTFTDKESANSFAYENRFYFSDTKIN